jgi:hypothetical protein
LAGNFASGTAGFLGIGIEAVTTGAASFGLLVSWDCPTPMLAATTVKAVSNDPDKATKRARMLIQVSDSISRLSDTGDRLNKG